MTIWFKSYLILVNMPKTSRKITIGMAEMIQAAIELLLRLMKLKIASGDVSETRKAIIIGRDRESAMK